MKNGYMFFLNLGTVTYMARILLIITVIAFFSVNGFYQRLILGVCLAVLLLISVIKAPSDKDVMRAVQLFRERFKEKLAESGHEHSMRGVRVLEAYRVKGSMKLKRNVGYDLVYPHLISLALAKSDKGSLELYIDELCLFYKGEPEFSKRIVNASNFRVSANIDTENEDVVELTIGCEGYREGIKIITRNDYHYREFMELISSELNI